MFTLLRSARLALIITLLVPAASATPEANGSVYPDAHVMEIARKLEAKLRAGADLSGILEQKLNDSTQIAVRTKSGRAEFHQNAGDVFFVLSGEATLISGGIILNPQGSGEIRGDSITGGTSALMRKGDIVYVPPATPHQVKIGSGVAFLYVVVKVPRKTSP
jgi:mannose-6-phosphate isomerase-like protein (cupin superfamily)